MQRLFLLKLTLTLVSILIGNTLTPPVIGARVISRTRRYFKLELDESETQSEWINHHQFVLMKREISGADGGGNQSSEMSIRNQCSVIRLPTDSAIGTRHQVVTCPFDWVLDKDPDRIPEKMIEQVCRAECRYCGPFRTCKQLKIPYHQVFYKSTGETLELKVRSSCVCLPLSLGSSATPIDI